LNRVPSLHSGRAKQTLTLVNVSRIQTWNHSCANSQYWQRCDADKVAATYDHAVVDRATSAHHQVVFVAIDGSVSGAMIKRRVAAAGVKVRGVVTGTLRTSMSPLAFSFALDGKQSPAAAGLCFPECCRRPGYSFDPGAASCAMALWSSWTSKILL
jgi:hypothetical protein